MGLGTEIALIKALGGGSSLPPITSSDAGKVLAVNNSGVWGASEPIGKKFIVTLTPTAADYSGTMDKTVSDIDAAYKAGRKVVFRVMTGAATASETDVTSRFSNSNYDYDAYEAFIVDTTNNLFIRATTTATNDGTKQTYSTKVYTLTPAT